MFFPQNKANGPRQNSLDDLCMEQAKSMEIKCDIICHGTSGGTLAMYISLPKYIIFGRTGCVFF
jgi:hypothetical protein